PSNYVIASEWKRESNFAMRRLIQSKRRHFHNAKSSLMNYVASNPTNAPKDMLVDDAAVSQVADLGSCLQEIDIHGRHFGQFAMTVVVYDLDRSALKRSVAECIKVFAAHDEQLTEERRKRSHAWRRVV